MRALAVCLLAMGSLSHVSGADLGSNDRVLVATGFIQGEGLENARTSEVVDVTAGEDKTCKSLDQAPNNRWASIGGVLNGRPLICGGFNGTDSFKDCFYVERNRTYENTSMTEIRSFAASVNLKDQSSNDYLWITGGYYQIDVNTTEFLYSNNTSVPGPTLDFIIAHHCMAKVDDDTIYMVGGKQDGEISNNVWVADPTNNFAVKKGPSLKDARYFHSCAAYEDSAGVKKIVVAGGFGPSGPLNSVEILDASTSNEWKYGPSLPPNPDGLYAGAMVTAPHGKGVIGAMGNVLIEFGSGATNWTILSQKLKYV